jgi:hypothetical protein
MYVIIKIGDNMKKKHYIILEILAVIIFVGILVLYNNKTFFKDKYIGVNKQEIFIPRYSYFDSECCMTAATFYSLKSEGKLKKEIDNYLKDFDYFENDSTYGYQKGDLFIQKYEVINKGLYRQIVITY